MLRTTDLRIHCPDVKTQQDEMMIHTAMAAAPGISLVEVNYRSGEVHIVTANQDGGADVLERLDAAGFPPHRSEAKDGGFERVIDPGKA